MALLFCVLFCRAFVVRVRTNEINAIYIYYIYIYIKDKEQGWKQSKAKRSERKQKHTRQGTKNAQSVNYSALPRLWLFACKNCCGICMARTVVRYRVRSVFFFLLLHQAVGRCFSGVLLKKLLRISIQVRYVRVVLVFYAVFRYLGKCLPTHPLCSAYHYAAVSQFLYVIFL